MLEWALFEGGRTPWSLPSDPRVRESALPRVTNQEGHTRAPNNTQTRCGRCHQRRRRARDGRSGRRTGKRCGRHPRRPDDHAAGQRQRGRRHLRPGLHPRLRRTRPRTARPSTSTFRWARRSTAQRPPASRASTRPSTTNPDDDFIPCAEQRRERLRPHAGADRLHGRRARRPDRRRRRRALWPDGCRRSDRAGERLAGHGRLQRAGRELLRLRRGHLHGRLLRARLHRVVRHERHRHRRVRLGEPRRPRRLGVERRRCGQRPADAL